MGTLRALIAGLLGFLVAYVLGRSLQAAEPGHPAAFIGVAIGVPLIVAMVFIVAAEALVPSGMLPRPLEIIRGTRQAIARSRRYWQISRIAVRHGLAPYLRGIALAVPKTAAEELIALVPVLRGCHGGSTASPARWSRAGSASTCGCSPTSATAGWSRPDLPGPAHRPRRGLRHRRRAAARRRQRAQDHPQRQPRPS